MKNDMSDMMQKLSSMLNGKEVPEDLKNVLSNYMNNNSSNSSNSNEFSKQSNSQGFPNFENFTSSFNTDNAEENSNNDSSNPFSNIDINTILKMKQIMEKMNSKKDDPRSNLLLSLKPYLKSSRKQKVDQYIQLFNMSSIMENLNPMGGEKTK